MTTVRQIDVNALQARFDAVAIERDQAVSALAAERTALKNLERSLGLAPAAVIPVIEPDQAETNTMPRAQFNAMKATDRNDFIRKGGKLTE